MRNRDIPKTFLASGAVLALAGCNAPADGSDSAASANGTVEESADALAGTASETIPMAGSAWLSVGEDGAVQTTLIDAGGRYRDIRNGETFGQGTWEQRPDGAICFEPETGLGACWKTESGDADGSVLATNGDDKQIELKRVTYTAPPEAEEDAGG